MIKQDNNDILFISFVERNRKNKKRKKYHTNQLVRRGMQCIYKTKQMTIRVIELSEKYRYRVSRL